jgi:predicted nucleotidyltransferase
MKFQEKIKKKKFKNLAQKYSLELLLLFGSRVSGKTHQESDYDIAYLSKRKFSLDKQGRLIMDLLPLLGEYDERLINLVNIKKASPLLLYTMTTNSLVLFEKKPASFACLRAYAFKKYIETKPLYKEKAERLQKELAS